jgi:hypothetical protein
MNAIEITELDVENSEDYVLVNDFIVWVETTRIPFKVVNIGGFLTLKYANSEVLHPVLTTPSMVVDEFIDFSVGPIIAEGQPKVRIFVWFNLKSYVEKIVETGMPSPHRVELCEVLCGLRNARSFDTPDIIQVLRTNTTVSRTTSIFAKACLQPVLATEVQFDSTLFKTPPWSVQKYFISRAIDLDSHGTTIEWYNQDLVRLANRRGDAIFVDVFKRYIVHHSEVQTSSVTFKGGFLIDSVGLGKTFSMLSLCAINSPPESYGIDEETGEYLKRPDGRIYSRATLIICPAQVSAHWSNQIELHLSKKYTVLNISCKRDFDKYTLKDLLTSDFVIITFNFATNAMFKAEYESYGPAGWNHFNSRVGNAIHDSKRRRPSTMFTSKLMLPHVYFWRLVVDELHELENYNNRSTMMVVKTLSARAMWGVSASILGSPNAFELSTQFITQNTEIRLSSGLSNNYDFVKKFPSLFVRSDPNNLNDITLPGIKEEIHWLNLSDSEMRIYRSLHHSEALQIRCCCMPKLVSQDIAEMENCASVEDAMTRIRTHMQVKLARAQEASAHWVSTIDRTRAMIAGATDARVLRSQLLQAERQLEFYAKQVEDTQRSLRFVHEQSSELPEDCGICLERITVPTFIVCGHNFCEDCITRIMGLSISQRRCPSCRLAITSTGQVFSVHAPVVAAPVSNVDQDELNLIKTHGTKVAAIIRFIREKTAEDPTEKFVIFSRIDSLLHEVGALLSTHIKVLYCRGTRDCKIKSIKRFEMNEDCPVLLLSAQNSGSGVCLTMARNIVVLDVCNSSPSVIAEIEKQITGRVYRPPQTKEVRLHRFLVRDTIEETIYENTLRHIDLRSVWNTRLPAQAAGDPP